jgi:hypothetical protein
MEFRGRKVDYVANQLLVGLKRELASDRESRESVLKALPPGSVLQGDFDRLGIALIDLPEGSDIMEVARRLEEHNAVVFAEPNLLDRLSLDP